LGFCDPASANLDSTVPRREPDLEMAQALIEIKGLNASKQPLKRLIWTAVVIDRRAALVERCYNLRRST